MRPRQLPSKPSSNQSWVPGQFDAQNSCDQNVFFFFSRDKGVLVVPVLYKDCEKFHVYKEISSRTNQYAWDDRRLFKTPHTSFTMLLLHFPSDFETPDQFLWFFNRFLTGRDDVTIKDIKGADKGRGDDLEC